MLQETEAAVFSMEEVLQLSKGGRPYQWICTTFIGCVVGSKAWNKKKCKERFSEVATCSDEAFLLLTLENNYQRWLSEAAWTRRNKALALPDREPKALPGARYTNSGTSKRDGRSRRLHGWAREGYLRFNELYQLVAKDRNRRTKFETTMLEMVCDAMHKTPALPGTNEEAQEDIFPANDLFAVDGKTSDADQLSDDEASCSDNEESGPDDN